VFSLDSPEDVDAALQDVAVIVLMAGPFSRTAEATIASCLRTKTHYIDITGGSVRFCAMCLISMSHRYQTETPVFQYCFDRIRMDAERAGVIVIPGCGFDIVPTDCLAATLGQKMKDAQYLDLAVPFLQQASAGTTKSILELMVEVKQMSLVLPMLMGVVISY
jgi:short subunit dehydrogenase-like uncharacterized protein